MFVPERAENLLKADFRAIVVRRFVVMNQKGKSFLVACKITNGLLLAVNGFLDYERTAPDTA